MSYGLILPNIETHKEGVDHVLGSADLPEPVVLPSADWEPLAPVGEMQRRNGVETNSCTVQGTENAVEMLDRLEGVESDYSDRYVANYAKQKGYLNPAVGASPHDIAEVVRKMSGQVNESDAPWADDFYGLDTSKLTDIAATWYKKRKLAHKWVFLDGTPQEKREKIKDALTKGPVCASVYAWTSDGECYIKPPGARDNHWVTILSANNDKPYRVLDSYPESEGDFIKDLDPFYDFSVAKVYFYRPLPFLTNLYYGITHEDVPRLQRALISFGYSIPNGITDFFGGETRKALWQFQVANGIADDGSHFGPKTRLALTRKQNPDDYFGGSISTFLLALFSSS